EDGDRGIAASVWNVFNHLLHDERISNEEANNPWCITTGSFAHDLALIKFCKRHQAGFTNGLVDCVFQLSDGVCPTNHRLEFGHIWIGNRSVESCDYLFKRLGIDETESLDLD